MIVLRVSETSERLTYVADLIFRRLLGLTYRIVGESGPFPRDGSLIIDYTRHTSTSLVAIPNLGLLHETGVRPQKFEILHYEIPYLFAKPSPQPNELEFDIFSAAFYLVTEYEKWATPVYDAHGRYDETAYLSHTEAWYLYPLVHLYAERLWKFIAPRVSQEKPARPSFSFRLTFDIDHPWKFLKKGWGLSIGGLVKDIGRGDWGQFQERSRALWTGKDPNQSFDTIFQHCDPSWTQFFFLVDRASPHDGRFTYQHPGYQHLIRQIQEKDYPVGIHPSYTSYLDASRIQVEKTKLESIIQQPVFHSRQHYLRYRYPDTFQYLAEAGIKEEYTLANYSTGGFRTGMAVPYPWFDLSTNRATELLLHPTILMDVTLTQYQGLTPEEGIAYAEKLVQYTHQVGGTFTLLLHNDTLSDSGMWKGWKKHWLNFIEEVERLGKRSDSL